jgi:hypothetical protein
MKILGLSAAAAAIFATAALAAPAAQAGPFFHPHGHFGGFGHHGYWGGGLTVVGVNSGIAADDCYYVRRRVLVPGIGIVKRRELVCG